MLNIAICDDNRNDLLLLKRDLEMYLLNGGYEYTCSEFSSGIQLLGEIESEDGKAFDIIFLDIVMPGMTGLETAAKIRERSSRNEHIIFITTSDEYALECYEVFAYSYIVKPLVSEKLFAIMDRLINSAFAEKKAGLLVKSGSKYERINLHDIVYIESRLREVTVYLTDGTFRRYYSTLDKVEDEIDKPYFLRSHKSFLINMNHITAVHDFFVTTLGQNVPIRKNGAKLIKDVYLKYVTEVNAEKLLAAK